nr:hypothetical protein [Tanacetum cinerariifolium]
MKFYRIANMALTFAGHGLIRSPSHDAQTIARAADRAENVGYVRALQTSERMMMTSIEEVNLRLEIDIVRGQRTAYETELQEGQSAEDLVVTQMMRIHALEARARTDMVEDADISYYFIMPVTREGTNDAMTLESIQAIIDWAIKGNSTHTQDDASQSSGGGLRRHVQPTRVCSYTDFMKCQPLNFKGTEGIVGLSQWLKKMKSVFHISGCAVDNQVKFTTCTLLRAALTCRNGHVRTLGHIKKNYPKLKNSGNGVAQGRAYVLGGIDASPDSNVIMGTFLLNNRYAKVLFDTGADRSFVSTTFSALIDITPTTLENHYDVELANGMDWLTKYHGVIICDEKIVCVPFGREMLIFQGNRDNQREESRLNIISCTKAQEYLLKGCDVFLAHITTMEKNRGFK